MTPRGQGANKKGGLAAAGLFRHSGRSVFGAIRNPEVIYIEIPGSRLQRAPE
jgi:hypothetical protein